MNTDTVWTSVLSAFSVVNLRAARVWITASLLLVLTHHLHAQQLAGPSDDFRRIALETVAGYPARNFQMVAAKLRTGRDTALAWRQLDTLLAQPAGDMFWTYPAVGFYFYCKDLLSDEWKARFRRTWKTYTPYRGDTENHFLMHYGALYLMAQEWPDLPGSEWFNGKSSTEIFEEADDYLDHWIDETAREGLTEWDSPRYLYYYITPLLTLYDHARSDTMKRRVGMILELLLADYAAEYLNGSYCGAHSRDADGSVIDPRKAEVRSYSQFYWEDTLDLVLPDLAFAAMSSFRCPAIIRDIAHDRSQPYTHYEQRRSRAKIRYARRRYDDVFKTTYMTADYALGSIQGGLQQPIQQHTWDVTFAARRPNNTIFALHPYASGIELGTFFPEEPELMEKGILSSKASYGSEDKWIGGSPYETIHQLDSVLVGWYRIPLDVRFRHVDFFLPATLDTVIFDAGGWIFCRMENAFVGINISSDSLEIRGEERWTRVRSHGGRTFYSVECGRGGAEEFERFRERLPDERRFERHDGRRYYRFGDSEYVELPDDGVPIRVEKPGEAGKPAVRLTTAFSGPFIVSDRDAGTITLRARGATRTLDFLRNEIRDEAAARD